MLQKTMCLRFKIKFLLFLSGFIFLLGSAYSWVALSASNKLLNNIASVLPGENILNIRKKLGKEIYFTSSIEEMIQLGSISDKSYLKNKQLSCFYTSMPPARMFLVYSDMQGNVVYVSWKQL